MLSFEPVSFPAPIGTWRREQTKGQAFVVAEALYERLKINTARNTTPDMLFTVETVSCLGACGLAPVVVVNEEVHGQMTPAKALELVDAIIAKENA